MYLGLFGVPYPTYINSLWSPLFDVNLFSFFLKLFPFESSNLFIHLGFFSNFVRDLLRKKM